MADEFAGGGVPAEPQTTPTVADVLEPPQDHYANEETIRSLFKLTLEQALDGRNMYERTWWRVLLYLLRRQWIFYDSKRGQWRDKRLAQWIPKPTNTKMNEVQQSLRSMFAAVELGSIVRPNGQDPKNVITAEAADALEPLLREEHKMPTVWADADFWLTALGNVILHPWWNPDEGPIAQMPAYGCPLCQAEHPPATIDPAGDLTCPACKAAGEPEPGMLEPIPESEQPIPQGKGCTDVVSPFEMLVPSGYLNWTDVRELVRPRWRTKSYVEGKYPELAKTLTWSKAPNERSIQLLKAISGQSDLSGSPFGIASSGSDTEGIVEYELWAKARPDFPQGLIARFLGDGDDAKMITDQNESLPGPIPYLDANNLPLWPWIHVGYDTFGGRLWSQGPLEMLIANVDKINRLDSRIELIVDRVSNPVWLEPKGAQVERIGGMPGIIIRYHQLGANGGKPERIDGMNVPASLFELRNQYLAEIEASAGTNDILKGERPPNIEAYSALNFLAEQGQKRFTSAFKARGTAYQEWFTIALELERQWGPPERVQAALGPNRTWGFQVFQKADLSGNVSIVVEDGTTTPKTSLGKRASIVDANQLKLINPADPDQAWGLFGHLGLRELVPSLDKAVSAALREQHMYEEWVRGGRTQGPNPLVRIDYVDNDQLHAQQHKLWAMGDAIRDLMLQDPQALQEIQLHIFAHENGAFQMAMAQNQAKAPAGGGKPPGAAGAAQAMPSSNRESGNPQDEGLTSGGRTIS